MSALPFCAESEVPLNSNQPTNHILIDATYHLVKLH